MAADAEQPVASGSTPRAPSPPPPAVLPFAPPPHPKTHLTGSLDLLSHLSLLPSYDTYVRPWFRNPKPPVALPAGTGTVAGLEVTTALTSEEKGKGKATDGGAGGKAGGGGTGGGTGGAAVHAQQGKKKDTVVDLKRMKGDFDDLVEECVVIPYNHPAVPYPPTSLHQLVYEAPEEGPGFPPRWSDSLRVIPPQELVKWGWTLQEGRLPEADDVSLFVRTPKLQSQKKKKPKRPRPSEDLANGSGSGGQPHQGQQQDANKRQKQSGGALTPRTPGLAVGTPGGSGRTPGARG